MEYTRVDSKKLSTAVKKAVLLLLQADEAVADVLELLTPEQRSPLPKPRDGFAAAAKTVAQSADLNHLKSIADFDGEAVLEDIANVGVVDELSAPLDKLVQRVADSKLLWLAEAYGMSMDLYKFARVAAKTDAVVAKAIEPLVAHLSLPRFKRPETK